MKFYVREPFATEEEKLSLLGIWDDCTKEYELAWPPKKTPKRKGRKAKAYRIKKARSYLKRNIAKPMDAYKAVEGEVGVPTRCLIGGLVFKQLTVTYSSGSRRRVTKHYFYEEAGKMYRSRSLSEAKAFAALMRRGGPAFSAKEAAALRAQQILKQFGVGPEDVA